VEIQLDDRTALILAEPEANPFELAYTNQAHHQLRLAWAVLRDRWLRSNRRGRPNSHATRRAYEAATNLFAEFTGLDWWLITSDHVRAWQTLMEEQTLSRATINQRLSAVSSFYSYVLREQRLGSDGIERGLFFDAQGRTRANPFKTGNLERVAVNRKGKSRPISPAVIIHMMNDITVQKLDGARDYALLKCFLLTGWRSNEVLSMTWGDIRPNDDRPGEYIFAWRGKGAKEQDDPFPAPCYHAIIAYLKLAGRWLPGHPEHIQDADYIWQPLREHGLKNFPNVVAVSTASRPISPTQANNILRKHLRRALRKTGLTNTEAAERAQTYHVHNLRHTFAHNMRKAGFDVLKISKRMHHSSIAVTQLYLDSLEAPIDDYSQALQLAMGI
jgi:site-specific recombinase XerD